MRATAVDPASGRDGATILEVFDPMSANDILRCRRSIAAAHDGRRWIFEQTGNPFEFEDVDAYRHRRVLDRFTPSMLERYLARLGVPVDLPLHLAETLVVETA